VNIDPLEDKLRRTIHKLGHAERHGWGLGIGDPRKGKQDWQREVSSLQRRLLLRVCNEAESYATPKKREAYLNRMHARYKQLHVANRWPERGHQPFKRIVEEIGTLLEAHRQETGSRETEDPLNARLPFNGGKETRREHLRRAAYILHVRPDLERQRGRNSFFGAASELSEKIDGKSGGAIWKAVRRLAENVTGLEQGERLSNRYGRIDGFRSLVDDLMEGRCWVEADGQDDLRLLA